MNKSLESCRSICQAKGHDIPLEGTIPCAEHSFPFITFCNADQMVHMVEINLRIDLSLAWGVEEIHQGNLDGKMIHYNHQRGVDNG